MRRTLALATVVLIVASCSARDVPPLPMATTTSVGNSGLLDVLLASYRSEAGVSVQAHLVGSGRALAMLASGDAALAITHAPEAEAAALRTHPGWIYRKIMYNDFVIVGPREDPAHVRAATGAADAMRRIATSSTRFLSRGDESGTHERERRLWTLAGARPAGDRLVTAGAGMGTTLRVASEASAYTLTDRSTFNQLASGLRLEVLCEYDPELLNTYAVVFNPGGSRARDAGAFAEWLSSAAARDLIAGYRVGNTPGAFAPWPPGRAANRPEDLPK
jgi:tungstate transport system substrate-binding protein